MDNADYEEKQNEHGRVNWQRFAFKQRKDLRDAIVELFMRKVNSSSMHIGIMVNN
jgi:hypothetical protein